MIIEQIKVGFMEVFCYLLGCETTKRALLIDPAGNEEQVVERARSLDLTVESIVNTHGHPDHTCGNQRMVELTGARLFMHVRDDELFGTPEGQAMGRQMGFAPSPRADVQVSDGDVIPVGEEKLTVLHTPGHTPGGICLYTGKNVFTGDTLFVGAVGRTDFPGGSMEVLLASIKDKILSLPDDTIIWPGHDYGGSPTSTVGREKTSNPYVTGF
jgi:glyoxylase-like metal-dependent hydrolase (beta-lactamase superfamily II)